MVLHIWTSFALTAAILIGADVCSGVMNPYHFSGAAESVAMKDCLKCHKGGSAPPVAICLGNNCLYSNTHSVMHRYPPVGKENDYAPVEEIKKAGCILENGKITCLSCHDLTKPPPHLIRNGDALCLICHIRMKSKKWIT